MSATSAEQVINGKVQIPIELLRDTSGTLVVSLPTPRTYLREPFFVDSLVEPFNILKPEVKVVGEDKLLTHPVHYNEKDSRLTYTSIDDFIRKYTGVKITKKLGFIFHMSRCGSTLATQMLASNDKSFVLSEPTIINTILDPSLKIKSDKRIALLNATVNALVSCSPVNCEQVFIKFRSWGALYIDYILERFQNTPWMFIHRYSLEVLQSVLEKPPGWLRCRKNYTKHFSGFLGVGENYTLSMSDDEYIARMLGAFCRAARCASLGRKIFIDYKELKSSLVTVAESLLGTSFNDSEVATMSSVSEIYSKDARKIQKFQPDSERKRAKATANQINLTNEFAERERLLLSKNIKHGNQHSKRI
jgi:hypothetical protein